MQAIGLIFSVALHGALLFWAALEILGTSELPEPAAPTIEAEIISISEFTKLKQGDPESKKLVAKATPEVEPQVSKKEAPRPKPPKPTPPPAAEEPPPKLPEPEPPKAETPPLQPDKIAEKIDSSSPPVPAPPDVDAAARKKKAEIQRKYKEKLRKEAERKRKLAEKKRREAKKKKKAEKKRKEQDFTKRMAALLDKTPEERGSRRSGSSLESEYLGPVAGEREGSGDELTAREADLLKGQISAQLRDCWRLPGGGGGIEVVQVRLSWRLKRDGALEGEPQVIGTSRDPTFRVAAEAAIRAVKCAAPFQLPSENYEAWRYIKEWNFDPRQML